MAEEKQKKPETGIPLTPGMDYEAQQKNPVLGQNIPEKVKKEMDATRKKLDKFKKEVLKKYPFTLGLAIIPPQAADKFDEEMALTEEEKKEKPMHITMVIPEDNFKQIGKIKTDLLNQTKDFKPKLWLNIITPVDLANYCLDSKFDIIEAIGMGFPLHDKNILGAFRVSQIHKSLCLRKFEKYIYSYVVFGSLIRGEGTKGSDVDVFVIIDDTDVKRMPRLELKEKLRGIIYQYVAEATELAGVKKELLHPQVYLLTEFWESVKDASPVIFTAIRDGIPLYDRGGFLPWKLLLKMGKITPTPESVDKFMSMGDKNKEIVNRRLVDAMIDIFYSVLSPSQALLMLYGIPPPDQRETIKEMKRIFVDKEKILEKKYVDILEKIIIKYYKAYEHGERKEVSGKEVDMLLKDSEEYIKRLKDLREEIEKRSHQRTIEDIYNNVFKILKGLFGNKAETALVKEFEAELVSKGKTDPKNLNTIKDLVNIKKKYKTKKKPGKYEVEDIRKDAAYLINQLIDYGQRCELENVRKMQVRISYGKDKNKHADLFLTNPGFVLLESKIWKIGKDKFEETSQEEFENIVMQQRGKPSPITKDIRDVLKKEFGNFSISV